jgi:hypothetical protein
VNSHPLSSDTRLFTSFGTVVYVDPTSQTLRHGPDQSSPANLTLTVQENRGRYDCRLLHGSHVGEPPKDCTVDRHGANVVLRESTAGASLELMLLERGLVTLKLGSSFLSAYPEGNFGFAEICSTWELYLLSSNLTAPTSASTAYTSQSYARRDIQEYIVHPTIRARTGAKPRKEKLLAFGYPAWSHGRVYYDLCKHLHQRGYIIDILNWQHNHAGYFEALRSYYDCLITALDGVSVLVDTYKVPYEQIIAVSHHEFDIQMLIERKGIDVFEQFSNYAVVSDYVYCASMMRKVSRSPMVARLGIDYQTFYSPVSQSLNVVGYASSMSTTTYGVEWKRGALAEAAATSAGLAFKVAGSTERQTSFHEMPEFYRTVDAVVTSSISEAAQLPVMEAAAAGRLVIGTPVGHFPQKAYDGGGILAPVEANKFISFTTDTLRFYKENPSAYADKCHSIQEAAKKFDWEHSIQDWVDVIENRRK